VKFITQSALYVALLLVPISRLQPHDLHGPTLRLYCGEGLSWQLFSSCTDAPFARIEIQRVSPGRVGLFGSQLGLGMPGYRIAGLQVSLFPVPCSTEDWEHLLEVLRPLKSANAALRGGVLFRLPNGRALFGPNPPEIKGETLIVEALHSRKTLNECYLIGRDSTGAPCVSTLYPRVTIPFPSHENKTNK
jgi:hypothetical protein